MDISDSLLVQQLRDYFNEFYQVNKRAITLNANDMPKRFLQRYSLSTILCTNPEFYQLTSRTFGLLEWLVTALEKQLKKGAIIDFEYIVEVAKDVYGRNNVNLKNLQSIFTKEIMYHYNQEDLDSIKQRYSIDEDKGNPTYLNNRPSSTPDNHLTVQQIFQDPIAINQAARQYNVEPSQLLFIANQHPFVHVLPGKKYHYVNKPKDTSCLLTNILNVQKNILADASLVDLAYQCIVNAGTPVHIEDIQEQLSYLGFERQILPLLQNDSRFQLVGYKEWALSQWNKFSPTPTNLAQVVDYVRDFLGERNWTVLQKYELSETKYTMANIGSQLGCTRERVRQILNNTKTQLWEPEIKEQVGYFIEFINEMLNKQRVLVIEDLPKNFPETFGGLYSPREMVKFIALYNPPFLGIGGNYIIKQFASDKLDRFLNGPMKTQSSGNLVEFPLSKVLSAMDINSTNGRRLFLKLIKNHRHFHYVETLDLLYCKNTPMVKADLAYIALKQLGEPAHYTEIMESYMELIGEETTERLIQSYLERNENIVRVFTGIWGLKEWGCEEHIGVISLAKKVLEQEKRVMHYREVYRKIQHRTMAKSSSLISLASMSDELVIPRPGCIALAKWMEDKYVKEKYGFSRADVKNNKRRLTLINTHKNEHGYYVTRYKLSGYASNRYALRVSTSIDVELAEKITLLDQKGRTYTIPFSSVSNSLFRLKKFYDTNQLQEGDIIYLEFVGTNLIRAFTQSEYENQYIKWKDVQLEQNTIEEREAREGFVEQLF